MDSPSRDANTELSALRDVALSAKELVEHLAEHLIVPPKAYLVDELRGLIWVWERCKDKAE